MARAAWYERQLERSRQARRAKRANNLCRWCGISIAHLVATARYCTRACQMRWHYEHGGRAQRGHARRAASQSPPQPTVLPPIVDAPSGHPIYDEALKALRGWERDELGGSLDSGARDLLQEYALAWLEGHDPIATVLRLRSTAFRERLLTVRGTNLVDGLYR